MKLKDFCASHADFRMQQTSRILDNDTLDAAAHALVVGTDTTTGRVPRNIIEVGLRAVPTDGGKTDMSKHILGLAEALNAPVLTRLHAKGVVDERHPLSFGVIGVHGKPGLKNAASLISTADCVISIGVEDQTLLVCNLAGLQIRKVIELEPDAMCIDTRFNADQTLVGNIATLCQELTKRVHDLHHARHGHDPLPRTDSATRQKDLSEQQLQSMWDYMAYGSPAFQQESDRNAVIVQAEEHQDLLNDTDKFWHLIHRREWKKLLKSKEDQVVTPRFVCDDIMVTTSERPDSNSSAFFCHPAAVLRAISMARINPAMDPIAREAVITVDVGDITLVRQTKN